MSTDSVMEERKNKAVREPPIETVEPLGGERKMEEKEYKNKVLFLRLSEKGEHVYAFQRDGILGGDVESIILNVSELKALLDGKLDWIKVSAMKAEETEEEE